MFADTCQMNPRIASCCHRRDFVRLDGRQGVKRFLMAREGSLYAQMMAVIQRMVAVIVVPREKSSEEIRQMALRSIRHVAEEEVAAGLIGSRALRADALFTLSRLLAAVLPAKCLVGPFDAAPVTADAAPVTADAAPVTADAASVASLALGSLQSVSIAGDAPRSTCSTDGSSLVRFDLLRTPYADHMTLIAQPQVRCRLICNVDASGRVLGDPAARTRLCSVLRRCFAFLPSNALVVATGWHHGTVSGGGSMLEYGHGRHSEAAVLAGLGNRRAASRLLAAAPATSQSNCSPAKSPSQGYELAAQPLSGGPEAASSIAFTGAADTDQVLGEETGGAVQAEEARERLGSGAEVDAGGEDGGGKREEGDGRPHVRVLAKGETLPQMPPQLAELTSPDMYLACASVCRELGDMASRRTCTSSAAAATGGGEGYPALAAVMAELLQAAEAVERDASVGSGEGPRRQIRQAGLGGAGGVSAVGLRRAREHQAASRRADGWQRQAAAAAVALNEIMKGAALRAGAADGSLSMDYLSPEWWDLPTTTDGGRGAVAGSESGREALPSFSQLNDNALLIQILIEAILRHTVRHIDAHPHVPHLFAAILRHTGAAMHLLPVLCEPANKVIAGLSVLSRHRHPAHTATFLASLLEIADAGARLAAEAATAAQAAVGTLEAQAAGSMRQGEESEVQATVSMAEVREYFERRRREHEDKSEDEGEEAEPAVIQEEDEAEKRDPDAGRGRGLGAESRGRGAEEEDRTVRRRLRAAMKLADAAGEAAAPLMASVEMRTQLLALEVATVALRALRSAVTMTECEETLARSSAHPGEEVHGLPPVTALPREVRGDSVALANLFAQQEARIDEKQQELFTQQDARFGVLAEALKERFTRNVALLPAVMYPLLERLGDPHPLVSSAAARTLRCIALHCCYGTLEALIVAN
eukprot:gene7943-9438_t